MKRNLLGLLLLGGFTGLYMQGAAQQLSLRPLGAQTLSPQVVNHAGARTTTCGDDYLRYALGKNLNGNTVSGWPAEAGNPAAIEAGSQWFDAPSPVTVKGVQVLTRAQTSNTTLTVSIHTSAADSTPGALLASTTLTSVAGPLAFAQATFSSPVNVSGPFVIVVENTNSGASSAVGLYTNYTDGALAIFSGRGEGLSRVKYAGIWHKPESLLPGEFDADWIFEPEIEYDITSDFTYTPASGCTGEEVTLTNTSSPIVQSRFYNVNTFINHFYGAPDNTFTWTLADGSTTNTVDALTTTNTPGAASVSLDITYDGWITGLTCNDSKTETIQFDATDDPSFSYSQFNFCLGSPDESPDITGGATGTFTASAPGLIFIDPATGEIDLTNSDPGTYTITFTTDGVCSRTATQTLSIQGAFDASFTYASDEYCENGTFDPLPVFGSGATAGTFSSSDPGLSLDPVTGEIHLTASAPGIYTVTNTISAHGACTASEETFEVTILEADNAGFDYSAASYCVNGINNPVANITGGSTGTFTSTAGLVFADDATGEIDLANSDAGIYTITFTTNGACPNTATFEVQLTEADNAEFAYSASAYCVSGTNPVADITGGSTGTFTSTAGLVFTDDATGEIDLANSDAGIYTITFTTNGTCPNTFDQQLEIVDQTDDASFDYSAASYCANVSNPVANITGGSTGTFTSTAGLVFADDATGEIDLASSDAGTYTITFTTDGACSGTETFDVEIVAADDADFEYSATAYCVSESNPAPNITGGSTGTFTSTAGLVFADDATGEIDLANSDAGIYTITFTTNGSCPNTLDQQVEIVDQADDASFDYSAASYCANVANPVANIIGGSTGTFTSTAGLVFADDATGEIDLANSDAGNYTITFTTDGACSSIETFDVEIVAADDADFEYSATAYCVSESNPVANITGGSTGTFTSTVGLVFADDATGEIDLAGSTPDSYTITFTTNGTCPSTFDQQVEITDQVDDASFDYSAASYCANDVTNPVANITGGSTGTFASTAGLVFADDATGEIDLAGSTPGSYTITFTTDGACFSTETFDVEIVVADDASFTYSAASYCTDASNPVANITGGSTGTFTSTSGLVFVNASTGEIDLAGSTPDSYTITFTTNGTCPSTETFDVAITALDDASFSYSASSYCQGVSNPVANITGGSTGTFSSTAGLVFVSTSTGEINLTGSTPDSYTITFTTNGTCPNSETFDVAIYELPTVTLAVADTLCTTAGLYTLTGGSPSGGAYTVDGTPATTFQPSAGNVGTHTLVYTYTDANGCSASASGTIEVEVCVNVEENETLAALKLFPNPTQGLVTIEAASLTQVEVLNTLGAVVLTVPANGNSKVTLDIQNQPNGIYFVRVSSVNGSVTKKVNLAK